MPNWCENGLTVNGEPDIIKKFKEKAKGKSQNTDLSLQRLYPMPRLLETISSPVRIVSQEEYDEAVKKRKKDDVFGLPLTQQLSKEYKKRYGADNWYDWHTENWGTKWDIEAKLISESEKQLIYTFESAWSPPTVAFAYIAKKFPELHFHLEFEEPGVGFRGWSEYKNGEWIDDFSEDFVENDDEEDI